MAIEPDNPSSVDLLSQQHVLTIENDEAFLEMLVGLAVSPSHSPAIFFEEWTRERLDLVSQRSQALYKGFFLPQARRILQGVHVAQRELEDRVNGQSKRILGAPLHGQTLETLLSTYYPEPQWAVHGLLPEGLLLLAGKPKQGKSYLALTIALAIAKQQTCLDHFPVTPGDVLCFSLEDYAKRVQKRMERLYQTPSDKHTIEFFYDAPKMKDGFAQHLTATLDARPAVRLVIIDTLRCIRDTQSGDYNMYQEDSDFMGSLNQCAQNAGTTILILHHTRKAKSDDVFDEISGTGGLRGATSGNMVLEETKGEADAMLQIEGKDFEHRMHVALKRQEDGSWTYVGEGEIYQLRSTKRAIVDAVRELGDEATAKEVWQISGVKNYGTVKTMLSRMASLGEMGRSQRGIYFVIQDDNAGVEV